jgi:hypothetical protein
MDEINYQQRVALFLPGQAGEELSLAEAIRRIMDVRATKPLTGPVLYRKNSPESYTMEEIRAIYARADFPR